MGVERKSLERSMTGAKALEGTDAQRQVRPGQSCCWRPSTRSHPDTTATSVSLSFVFLDGRLVQLHLQGEHRKCPSIAASEYAEWQEDANLNVIHSAIARSCSKQQLEQFFHSKDGGAEWRPVWEALWPFMCNLEILQIRVTKEFNFAKKYGPHALLLLLLRNMRCETDPIEPGHVSSESPVFTFSLAQPEGLLLPARNDHLCQLALDGLS